MGRIFIAILAVFLLLGAFASPINDGIKGWRTEDKTQSFPDVTTGAVNAANVTLSRDLFQANVDEVIAITSNITESPEADTYNESLRELEISPLALNQTRTLYVNYCAETENEVVRVLGPFLSFLIFGGLLFAIAYAAFAGKKR